MNVPRIVHESWHEPLKHLWSDPRLTQIQKQLAYFKFTPEARNIFRAFSLPLTETRVVMMALSPYSQLLADGTPYATGLAMGTPDVDTETLKSIRDALWNDYRDLRSEGLDLTLEHWHEQGVMLLNKSLTVTKGTRDATEHLYPRQYQGFEWPGWEWFTSGVVEAIDECSNSVIFTLLGSEACKCAGLISGKNYIVEAPHPVARYYYSSKNPGKEVPVKLDFSKAEVFSRIDEITFSIDKSKIQWFKT